MELRAGEYSKALAPEEQDVYSSAGRTFFSLRKERNVPCTTPHHRHGAPPERSIFKGYPSYKHLAPLEQRRKRPGHMSTTHEVSSISYLFHTLR